MPHSENEYNILEIINEELIILILYTLMGYTSTSVLSAETQWALGYVTIILIGLSVIFNLAMMIYQTIRKIKLTRRKQKATKAFDAAI